MPSFLQSWLFNWPALVLFISAALSGRQAAAQSPTWQTALAISQAVGNGSTVTEVVADAAGNVYLTGRFTNTATFGTISLVSAGADDIFVAKWTSTTKTFGWAYRAGGAKGDYATSIALVGSAIYVTGSFTSTTCAFGPTVLTGPGSSVLFVAKLTDAGPTAGFTWAKQSGINPTANGTTGQAIAASGTNLYLTGTFTEVGIFDAITLRASGISPNLASGFVTKMRDDGASGSFVWAKALDRGTEPRRIVCNGTTAYVGGYFDGPSAHFDTSVLLNASPDPNAGISDVFLAKITDSGSTGTFTWALALSGTGYDELYGLVAIGTSVYMAGYFSSATLPIGTTTLVNSASTGTGDAFIAKLTDAGPSAAFIWAQQAGGSDEDGALGLAATGRYVYVTGFFSSGSATFGTQVLANSNSGSNDIFVARLTDQGSVGTFAWAQQAGGQNTDAGFSVAVSGSRVYVGGELAAPAKFGALTLTNTTNIHVGYLASLTDNAPLATAAPTTANLTLYPNPARATTTVTLPVSSSATTLTLLNTLGQTVRVSVVPAAATSTILGLEGLAAGVYTLQTTVSGTVTTSHLVIY